MQLQLRVRSRLVQKRFHLRRHNSAARATIVAIVALVGGRIASPESSTSRAAAFAIVMWVIYFVADAFWPVATALERARPSERQAAEQRVNAALLPLFPPNLRCPNCDAAFWWSEQNFAATMTCMSCGEHLRVPVWYMRAVHWVGVVLGGVVAYSLGSDAFWVLMLAPFTLVVASAVTPLIAQWRFPPQLYVEDTTPLHIPRLGE